MKRASAIQASGQLPQETCWDCGVKPGELHHWGCEVECCPFCAQQAIGCPCFQEYRGTFASWRTIVEKGGRLPYGAKAERAFWDPTGIPAKRRAVEALGRKRLPLRRLAPADGRG